MAADEVLLQAAAAGQASLRFYAWTEATISLGYFQAASPCRAYPGLGGLALVRRATGGAALVHHLEVTYALALPAGPPWHAGGAGWARRMHEVITAALAGHGIHASLVGPGQERKMGEVLCFLHQTPDDLVIAGHKIVGSAQRKQRGALLQHGGILLAQSPHTPQLPGMRELSGVALSSQEAAAAITAEFAPRLGCTLTPAALPDAERRQIEHLAQERYSQPAWNLKR
jgi:lipoate-protein ligase A